MFIDGLLNMLINMNFVTGYLSNSNSFPKPLDEKEERYYITKLKEGDIHAKSILVEKNLRLVAHIVKKFNPPIGLTDDLISIGTIGLIKGVDSYQRGKNIKITTYAARCIENEILMYYRSARKFQNTVSLDDYIGTDKEGNKINLKDVIKDKSKPIEDELYLKDNIDLLKQFITKLSKREQDIIIKRYGLNNKKAMTQKEIAKEMRISRSYVSRIEKRAISKILREFIKKNKG